MRELVPVPAVDSNRSSSLRGVVCLALALGAHGLLSLLQWGTGRSFESPPFRAPEADQEWLIENTDASGAGPPGGGSPVPGARAAPEQPQKPLQPAPRAARATVRQPRPGLRDEVATPAPEPVLSAADLLAASDAEDTTPFRLSPARRTQLSERAPDAATAPEVAHSSASLSASQGSGFGARGGPGGVGSGRGGAGRNVFGGPSGAFRATVCFLETRVASLTEIQSCPAHVTFFTDALNVPPRRFTEGFPGVSDRHEWFAIRYRGKFKVQEAETFTFRLLSDDGSWLDIDGYRIIDNDRQHAPRSREGTVTLDAGEHEFSVFYYQGYPELIALQLFVKKVNGAERLFGPQI